MMVHPTWRTGACGLARDGRRQDLFRFLEEQLRPELFEEACAESGQPLTLNSREGYDHGYYFVSTFMEDHIRHHAAALNQT